VFVGSKSIAYRSLKFDGKASKVQARCFYSVKLCG